MLHPSTRKLIDKLGEMTRKQRVAWIEGEDGTVVHDTEGYRVILTPEPHSVLLTDAVGREIETCTPEEISDETDAHGRPYPQFVGELFREAHRHARGAERAIRVLLAGLEAADLPEPEIELPPPAEEKPGEPEAGPEAVTDETARLDGETAITAAVATLADQINNPPEPADAELAEPQPPRPPSPGLLQQRFSLSGIPYAAGSAAGAAPTQTPAHGQESERAETGPAQPLIIDATDDLPEFTPVADEEGKVAPQESLVDKHIAAPAPTRFNPWD